MDLIWQSLVFLTSIFFKYVPSLVILVLITAVILCRKYWKFRRMYDEFPSFAFEFDIARQILWERKEIEHFTNFTFQLFINGCRKFENDGLVLAWGLMPYLVVFSDEYVKIFSNEKAAVDKMWFYERILIDVFGLGLITSNGNTWKKSRKLALNGIHTQMMKQGVDAFNENAELLVKKLATVANGMPEDILLMLKKCSMDSFCESVLDVKLKSSENNSKIESYIRTLSKLLKFSIHRIVYPWLYYTPLLPLFASGREHRKYYEEAQQFSSLVFEEMQKSVSTGLQSAQQAGATVAGACRMSLSQLLFERYKKDPSFTRQDLQEEIHNLLIAGHDTVSYTMLWCLFMLGHHQDVQDKVFEELRSLPEDNLTYEDVSKLTYIKCVIKESMRLYPTVPIYARRVSKEVQCGKYLVPKGTNIVIASYLLHRNPHCYPDPEKFDPDRFSASSKIRPWAYVPFSEGIRHCIGKRFAMVEMVILLTHVIRKFKITSLTNTEEVDLCWDVMLTPARPILFQLKPRLNANICS